MVKSLSSRQSQYTKRKRLVLIATEGEVTEPSYFTLVNQLFPEDSTLRISKPGTSSNPANVLKKLENKLETTTLQKGDIVWLVVDVDNWGKDQLDRLIK